MTEFVIATGNKGKLEEFRRILTPLGIAVKSAAELGVSMDGIEETGETFAENARIKALAVYERSGKPTIADDSGLCVDALGGRPGVYSARYQGENASAAEKNAALLAELADTPEEKRTAHFACAICCVLSDDDRIECTGICEGRIGFSPSGSGGFGYDPVFYIGNKSFSELADEEKDAHSHRGAALAKLASELKLRYNAG